MANLKKSFDKDFITSWDNALSTELCSECISIFDASGVLCPRSLGGINVVKDTQLDLSDDHKFLVRRIYDETLIPCLSDYVQEHPYLGQRTLVSSCVVLQKTSPPDGGYHPFHAENVRWTAMNRLLAWMVYLNDVPERGETEFLYQGLRIKPKAGTVLIWPAGWTHLHRGNPPSSDKYILTGWLHEMEGFNSIQLHGE